MNSELAIEIILLICVFTATGFEIPMCCPLGYVFKESSRGAFRASRFECVQIREKSKPSGPLNGYNVKSSNKVEIPSCDEPLLMKISDTAQLSSSSCIFEENNEIFAVTCPSEDINVVSVLNKCCPPFQAYDLENKACVDSNLTNEVYKSLFNHAVIFSHQAFNCLSGVIVEYVSRYHQFIFIDSELLIRENRDTFSSDSYCLEATFNSSVNTKDSQSLKQTFMARTCNSALICNRIPCVRRCCSDRMKYIQINETTVCVPHPVDHNFVFHKFDPKEVRNDGSFRPNPIMPREYGILQGQTCEKYVLEPEIAPDDTHYFHYEDGSVHLPFATASYENKDYCVEFTHTEDLGIKPFTFVCFDDADEDNSKFRIYSIGLLISSAFSVITLIVYLSLPKLRNLPGKILVCLVFCQLASYLAMAIGQMHPTTDDACYPFAFFIYFSLMAGFSWMNVMCFDIWITFSSSERSHRLWKREEKRRFCFYSLYGWGAPILMTFVTVTLDQGQLLPKHLRPKFGGGRCWFEAINVAPHIIFFLGPAGILIMCNFIFFVRTLQYCNKVKREINRMQSTNSEKPVLRKKLGINKARFTMNFKLFVVMGVSWMLEIISTVLYDKKYNFVWMAIDLYNTLQGVLVFFIYVFKWRVWYLFLERFGFKHKNRYKSPRTTVATTALSMSGNSNLIRMKSMESCSSLLNQNVSVPPKKSSPIK